MAGSPRVDAAYRWLGSLSRRCRRAIRWKFQISPCRARIDPIWQLSVVAKRKKGTYDPSEPCYGVGDSSFRGPGFGFQFRRSAPDTPPACTGFCARTKKADKKHVTRAETGVRRATSYLRLIWRQCNCCSAWTTLVKPSGCGYTRFSDPCPVHVWHANSSWGVPNGVVPRALRRARVQTAPDYVHAENDTLWLRPGIKGVLGWRLVE